MAVSSTVMDEPRVDSEHPGRERSFFGTGATGILLNQRTGARGRA